MGKIRITTEEFIARASCTHNNKYDYSSSNYITSKIHIGIICPEHGEFSQLPKDHLRGRGCPKCGVTTKLSKKVFIKKANIVHNYKYLYANLDYKNMTHKIKIICPEHGEFSQLPRDHLQGRGCRKCGYIKNSKNRRLSTTEFIKKAKKIHGDNYNYTNIKYSTSHTKVIIFCNTHGKFFQTPMGHLQGQGCPKCATRGFNPDKEAIMYYLYDPQEELYKIGITNKDTSSRFGAGFIKERGIRILMEETYQNGQDALLAEQEILQAFGNYRTTNPTWPEALGGKTEFFNRNILELF